MSLASPPAGTGTNTRSIPEIVVPEIDDDEEVITEETQEDSTEGE